MRQRVDRLFYDLAHDKEESEEELKHSLRDWGLWCDADFILEAFEIWLLSKFIVLPFLGAWGDQPWYVRADFRKLLRVKQWHELQAKKPPLPNVPKFTDFIGGNRDG